MPARTTQHAQEIGGVFVLDALGRGADAALMAAEVIDNGFSIAAILSLAVREAMALSEIEDAISNTTRGFFSGFERLRSSAPLSPQFETIKVQLKARKDVMRAEERLGFFLATPTGFEPVTLRLGI